jgi:hypothetical protein
MRWSVLLVVALILVVAPLGGPTPSLASHQITSMSPLSGTIGTTVQVEGSGWGDADGVFTSGDIRVLFDGQELEDAAVAPNPQGEFETSFVVPDFAETGEAPVRFERNCSLLTSPSWQLTRVALAHTCANGVISWTEWFFVLEFHVDPDSGPAGSNATAHGAGWVYDLEECPVVISFDGQGVASAQPSEPDGTFSEPFEVPGLPLGTYEVEGRQDAECLDASEDLVATATFTITPPPPVVTPIPTLVVDPPEGLVGWSIDASGTDFTSSESLVLQFDGTTVANLPAGSPEFTSATTFTAPFTVPQRAPGVYTVRACQPSCAAPSRQAQTTFRVLPNPTLVVDPNFGRPGHETEASGTNWNRDLALRLIFDGTIVATIPANSASFTSQISFVHDIVIPNRQPGVYTVEGCQRCGTNREYRAETTYRIIPGPTLTLNPASGPGGSVTVATGEQFDHNFATEIRFGGAVIATIPANDAAWTSAVSFSIDLTVPDRRAAQYTVTACQRCGQPDQLIASATFRIIPTLFVDPDSGTIGSEFLATGGGWHHNERLELYLAGVLIATVDPGSDGFVDVTGFETPAIVPPVLGGPRTVLACQRCETNEPLIAQTQFTVLATLTLNPGLARPGFVTFAIGQGFPANTDVTLTWDRGIGGAEAVSDDEGTFRVPILLFRHDLLGPRTLEALLLVDDGIGDPELEVAATAPFLVVPGTAQPGDFVNRR